MMRMIKNYDWRVSSFYPHINGFVPSPITRLKLPTSYSATVDIIKNANGGRRRAAGTLNFQANGAENLLVPLPARPSESVPTVHFFMMRLFRKST